MALKLLMLGIVLPAIIALTVEVVAAVGRQRRLLRNAQQRGNAAPGVAAAEARVPSGGAVNPTWDVALALGLGYLMAYVTLLRVPRFPFAEVLDRHAMMVMVATALGVWLNGQSRVHPKASLVLVALWALLLPFVLLQPMFGGWAPLEAMQHVALQAAFLFCAWLLMEPLAQRSPGALLPLCFTLAVAALAFAIERSNTTRVLQLGVALAATVSAVTVVAFLSPRLSLARGGLAVLLTVAGGLCIHVQFYAFSDVPGPVFALLLLAPLGLWVRQLPALRQAAGWKRDGAGFAAVGLCLVLGLVWLFQAVPLGREPYF